MLIDRSLLVASVVGFSISLAGCGPGEASSSGGGGGSTSTAGAGTGGTAGSGGTTSSEPDPSDALFDPMHVVEVAIEMAPSDWDSLRFQSRDVMEMLGPGCHDAPHASPYTYFPASVTVDGLKLDTSGVRKKGFLGSASISKPSLKVSFDEFVAGREAFGVEGLTLNNSRQDPSLVKTCLAMQVFRDSGVPASRCNFAHVTLNGEDLGVYVHVEPIKKRFLARHFADETGNLYEGQLSDFRPGWTASYEKKTNESDPDRSDLDAVTNALAADDATVIESLGAVLDLDAFHRFWAAEALTAAWDGYASNGNNHFVYHDPSTGKMAFLPWGPDMSFDEDDPFLPASRPQSVSAKTAIPRRLYQLPETQAKYVDTMKGLLDTAWKEDALLAEIDRIQTMLAPYLGAGAANANGAANGVRDFVSGRRATIEAELSAPPAWMFPLPGGCLAEIGSASGTFSTDFGSLADVQGNPFGTGEATFDIEVPPGSPPVSATMDSSAAGYESGPKSRRELLVLGQFPDGKIRAMVFYVEPEVFAAGKDLTYDWQTVMAYVVEITGPNQSKIVGLGGSGTLHFDQAAAMSGAPVSGTFDMKVLASLFQ